YGYQNIHIRHTITDTFPGTFTKETYPNQVNRDSKCQLHPVIHQPVNMQAWNHVEHQNGCERKTEPETLEMSRKESFFLFCIRLLMISHFISKTIDTRGQFILSYLTAVIKTYITGR